MTPFTIVRSTSAEEALAAVVGHGPSARLYAGGVDLIPRLRSGSTGVDLLVDVKHTPGLRSIAPRGDRLRLGAAATHRMLSRSPVLRTHLPALATAAYRLGNPRVRAVGTLGGNLAAGVPESDLWVLAVAYGAEVELVTAEGPVRLPIGAWLAKPVTPAVVTALQVPGPGHAPRVTYHRFPSYGTPLAAAAAVSSGGRTTAVVGCIGVAPATVDLDDLPAAGPEPRAAVRERVSAAVDAVAALDASPDYRRHLAGVLAARAVADLAVEAGE